MMTLKELISQINSDFRTYGAKTVKAKFMLFLFAPKFKFLFRIRLMHFCRERKYNFLKVYFKNRIYYSHNCDISPECTIGKNVKFPHPCGIIIGAGAVIQDGATIYQGTTFGSHGNPSKPMAYPRIEENVTIYANAVLIGNITVGQDAVSGALSLVNRDILSGEIYGGVPARKLIREKD